MEYFKILRMSIKIAKKPKVKFLTLSCDIISLHKYSQPATCVAAEIETLFRRQR
jgi:hypothetical protein